MMSGVITLRNMLRRKSSQPSAPSASTIAVSGGPAAMIMNDTRRKKTMAIRHPATKPDARCRRAGRARPRCGSRAASPARRTVRPRGSVPPRSSASVLRISPTTVPTSRCLRDRRVEREDDQRELAVVGQKLAADDLVRHHLGDQCVVGGAVRQRLRETAAPASCPFSGGWRAENSEIRPRVPSISWRSVTRSRSFASVVAVRAGPSPRRRPARRTRSTGNGR